MKVGPFVFTYEYMKNLVSLKGVKITEYPEDVTKRLKELETIHIQRGEVALNESLFKALDQQYNEKRKEFDSLYTFA